MTAPSPARGRAPRWSLDLRDGVVADVCADGHPVLDAVYAAVRDEHWNTLPATVRRAERISHAGGVALLAVLDHTVPGDPSPAVTSTLTVRAGDTDGLTVTLDAEIRRPLTARRIGLSLLHPLELRGSDGVAATADGPLPVAFAGPVAPWQPATGMTGLSHRVAPGLDVRMAFEGAVFELEDHRNWCDPGWKSYCPPLSPGPPRAWVPGEHVRHTVRVTPQGGAVPPPDRPGVTGGDGGRPLPVFAVDADPVAGAGALGRALAAGAPVHLLLDAPGDWRERLAALGRIAAGHAVVPDLSVTLRAGDPAQAAAAAAELAALPGLRMVAVHTGAGHVTAPGAAPAVRRVLRERGSAALVGGGSALHLAELNRESAPPAAEWELTACAVTARAHHEDAALVLDTARALPDLLAAADRAGGGRPVLLAPVALRPRRTPVDRPVPADGADPREAELGAAWLAGVAAGSPGAARVAVRLAAGPGDGGPAGEVWALLARHAGAPARPVSTDPRRLTALRIGGRDGEAVLLLANPRARPVTAATPAGPVTLPGYGVRVLTVPSHHTEIPR